MDKLKLAREYFSQSPSRAGAITDQNRKRILRERGGVQGPVEVVPNPKLIMPSEKRMMREGRMDLANKPNPEFGKEMAREKAKQMRNKSYKAEY